MSHVDEPAQQLGREDFLVNFPVLLQRAIIPQQPQQQEPELLKGLMLVLFLHILKLNHVTVGSMRPDQQNNGILKASIFNVLGADIVVQHQVGEHLD
jgi:hypothetical protein